MDSSRRRASAGYRALAIMCLAASLALSPSAALGAELEGLSEFWAAFIGGKPTLDFRARVEVAEAQGREQSQAYTFRTRLGYGTKAWNGASLYGDFENIAAAAPDNYWNVVDVDNGRTPIADPTTTEVNQIFLKIEREDWLGTTLVGGRQRIKLDNDRFIGNVGWRQNEQTYDAFLGKSKLGVDELQALYSYLGKVRRIFGNQGANNPSLFDFDSNSHLINVSYDGLSFVKPVAFVYLLDLDIKESPGSRQFASASYGFRLTGKQELVTDLSLAYQLSYAYQTDYASNPVSYGAHYFHGDLALGQTSLGQVGVGYELLGSDDGKARFVTPLATLHKFNGWADVFLDNGGTNGLRDLYVYLAPKLPWKLGTRLVYHRFCADNGGGCLGNEFDALLERPINKYVSVLFKSAYFVADQDNALNLGDVWKVWFDLTVKF